MEKIIADIKEHPYLFGGMALIIALYFLWPRSTATNSSAAAATAAYQAQVEQGIASSAKSATQLAVAQDQVQIAGIDVAGAQAINLQNANAATSIATIDANTAQFNATTLANSQAAHTAGVLQSQTQAETFISSLEKSGLTVPQNINVMGAQYFNPPSPASTTPATANPYSSMPFIDSGSAGASGTAGGAGGNGGTSSGASAGGPGSY